MKQLIVGAFLIAMCAGCTAPRVRSPPTGPPTRLVAHDTAAHDAGMFRHFRPIFRGSLIANVGMTAERGNRLIAEGFADLGALGRSYIANPVLVERLATGAPLAEVDWKTVYGSGPRGYSDYPAIRRSAAK